MTGRRESRVVIVAVDSPMGQVVRGIDDLAAHLPAASTPRTCPLCLAEVWPCARFHDAASQVQAAGVRLAVLIPPDLHPLLWPQS